MNPSYSSIIKAADSQSFFHKNGWILFQDIYTHDNISQVREILDDLFRSEIYLGSPHDSKYIINDIYRHKPALARLLFNNKYFNAAKKLLGKQVVWLPECAIHRDRYAKWHKDTTEQEIGGVKSHRSEKSPLLQVSNYLQNYIPEKGGGITVVPGSQHQPDRFLKMYHFDVWNRAIRKIKSLMGINIFQKIERGNKLFDVPGKATDLVIFDIRTEHRASMPKKKPAQVKYAVFNTFGKPTQALRDYYEFMKKRPEPYYRFYRNYKLPKVILEIANENKVDVWH